MFGQPYPTARAPTARALRLARLRFARLLGLAAGRPVQVLWHGNRVRLASGRLRGGAWVLRLHEVFAAGGEAEAELLVALLVRRLPGAAGPLRLWFARVQAEAARCDAMGATSPAPASAPPLSSVPTAALPVVALPGAGCAAPATPPARSPKPWPPARAALEPPAKRNLLAELFAELNGAYFHGRCQASIRWGRATRPGRRRRRSMQLGCYDFVRREIRMHPALAEPWVPRYVVSLVVYHEMLHEVFGLAERNGRHCAHPPEFVVCEQTHPDYARARAWEAANLARLLAWRP